MKLVNLIGFELSVAGVAIPAGTHRAVAPQISDAEDLGTVSFDGVGAVPVIRPKEIALEECRLQPGDSPFPAEEEGTIFLATIPVRLAAQRAGRFDVWGMGDRIDPKNPAGGVKNLAR